MKNLRHTSRNFFFIILLLAVLLITICGCAPKIYVSSYSEPGFNFDKIIQVVVVPENTGRNDLFFAEIFTQTSLERKRFFLVRKNYVLEREISKSGLHTEADAFLKIAVTHVYLGTRTRFFPTSIGAYAKLVETGTDKMLWNMNYVYSSSEVGPSAPTIEEVMRIVVKRLVDAVPLKYTVPIVTALECKDVPLPAVALVKPAREEEEPVIIESEPPFKSGPYLVHVASVRGQRKQAAEEFIHKKTNDGAVRVATLVNLHSKGRWYRFLIGRFKSLDACESYLQTLEQSFEIHKDARSVKFPFSLSISSEQALGPSQMMIEALRKKGFLAYLSPSAGRAVNYDVMIGAYESEEEAALQANMLLQNGISAEIVSP